jgi:NAD(P)-dependent dehydrogenase (short-subunit alcohol dehydrogenase family)
MGFVRDRLELGGKVAVVTGAGQGIGRSLALGLADAGAAIVIAEVNEDTGPQVEQELTTAGHRALFAHTNVRDSESVQQMVATTVRELGAVDVLVNNAGGMFMAPAHELSERGFAAVIDLNVMGTWLCSHAAGNAMIEAGNGGSIINISSLNGLVGVANGPHYGAAKAAVAGLARSLAADWAEYGIRVNAIAPGGRAAFVPSLSEAPGTEHRAEPPAEGQVIGGGSPEWLENLACTAVYLASDMSSLLSGATIAL